MKQYRQAVSALVLRYSEACSPEGCRPVMHVLLVHKPRKRDAWQLPQGGIEAGESVPEAALRELREETGLDLPGEVHESTHSYCYDFPPEFVKRHRPVNAGQKLCFVVIEARKDVVVTVDEKEVDSYAWVEPSNLPTFIRRPEYLSVIRSVLDEYRGQNPVSKVVLR